MPAFVGYIMNEGSRASSFQVEDASIAFAVVVVFFMFLMEVVEVAVEEDDKRPKMPSSKGVKVNP
jgi:hypothetical protein